MYEKTPIVESGSEAMEVAEVIKQERRNPPISLKEVGKIGTVKKFLVRNEVEAEFKSVKEGIFIYTRGSVELRKAIKVVENCQVKAHCFMLPEEKQLKTVIKAFRSVSKRVR